jgi:hypothetical protein
VLGYFQPSATADELNENDIDSLAHRVVETVLPKEKTQFKLLFDPRRNRYEKASTFCGAARLCVRNFLFRTAATRRVTFGIAKTKTANEQGASPEEAVSQ